MKEYQTYKDYLNDQIRINNELNRRGDPDELKKPCDLMSKEIASMYWHDINISNTSDIVRLDWDSDEIISSFWDKYAGSFRRTPSDLFFAETIPIMDLEIEIDERNHFYDERNCFGRVTTYRVTIFSDYKERIKASDFDHCVIVGAITQRLPIMNFYMIIPIVLCKGVDFILTSCSYGVYDPIQKTTPTMKYRETRDSLSSWTTEYLQTWYGIQISLLHPDIKEVFSNPTKEIVFSNKNSSYKKRKRITRYVKKHIINQEMLDNTLSPKTSKKMNRKTLVWYVIGHWRHYKDGNRVFVKGYWKGALRHLKKNLDETRERIIDSNKEATA